MYYNIGGLMRGRKPIGTDAKTEMFTMRLTKKEKDVLDKNKWIKEEIMKEIREKINMYVE